jgi:hypothetical protein
MYKKNEWRIVMSTTLNDKNNILHEDEAIAKEEALLKDIYSGKIPLKKIFDDDIVKSEEFLKLGDPNAFIMGDVVLERLGITDKTLTTLAESGEFALGRIGGSRIIIAKTFFDFLDRYHFTKRRDPNDPVAIDPRGRIKKHLTYVKKKHTEVPKLRPIKDFIDDLGIEERTFVRHCELGTFTHYRIGSLYKMSEEDYTASLLEVALSGMKSNRGGAAKRVGRPNEVYEIMGNRLKELIDIED